MLDNALTRRLVTVPIIYLALTISVLLSPVLIVTALGTDLVRWLIRSKPWMGTRMLAFFWVYLVGEAWALPALAVAGLAPREQSLNITYRLQQKWAAWNFNAVRRLFGLDFLVSGDQEVLPGPILLISRHASMIDTLLPARYVTTPHGVRLRYVLKKELLVDPALDIAGNRLPNCFVDRAGDSESEKRSIRALARGLGPDEGVLIYPEGTRFSEAKRQLYVKRITARPSHAAEIAARLRRVLPPRPGGTMALLEATKADIVVLAHKGLEGFARVRDMWSGDLVGSQIVVRFWRIARSEVPEERSSRVDWLFDLWADIDAWVTGAEALAEGT